MPLVLEETDRLIAALAPLASEYLAEQRRLESLVYRQSLELLRAFRCAPTLEVCEAILRNPRKVPVSSLDYRWAKAYGLIS